MKEDLRKFRADLGFKLVGSAVLIGFALAGGITALSIDSGVRALTDQASDALVAVRRSRQRNIEDFFHLKHLQMLSYARLGTTVAAAEEFGFAFLMRRQKRGTEERLDEQLGGFYESQFKPVLEQAGDDWHGIKAYMPTTDTAKLLQFDYLVNNPHPLSDKDQLDTADRGTQYDRVHARYHPALRGLVADFDFYDLFIFDLSGNLVYSVFKEIDFATNFLTGPHKNTGLATAYRRALESNDTDATYLVDFSHYAPSYDSPQSFIAASLFRGTRKVGVIALQIPVSRINAIMAGTDGLGATGETFLMGDDQRLRTQSRFDGDVSILKQTAGESDVIQTLDYEGMMRIADYRNVEALWSFAPLTIKDLDWRIVAKIDSDEIMAPARDLRRRIVLFATVLLLFAAGLGYKLLSRLVLKPVRSLALGAGRISSGDFAHRVKVTSQDAGVNVVRA